MLRQILTCFALTLAPAINAANTGIHRAAPDRSFEPVVIITKQPAYHDFYIHTLGDVAPEFQDIASLWAEERVFVFVLPGNYAVNAANNADLTFDLVVERPDGTKASIGNDLKIYQGKMDDPQTVPFPENVLAFSTSPGDPIGVYTFVVTVHDRIGNETRVVRKKLQVVSFKSVEPPASFSAEDWMMSYYRIPQPELALPALRAMAKKTFPANDGAWPPTIGFYDALLANNPWLVPVFAEAMHHGTENEMRAIARVLGYALRNSAKPPAGVTAEEWTALAGARAEKWPDPDAPLTDPAQLDMLWGRFFATGAFEPVNRIASTVEYYPFIGRLDEIKKSGQNPTVMPPDVMKEITLKSALWSLGSIAKQQPLVHHYGEWILAKATLDASSQLLLTKALTPDIKVDSPKQLP